MAAAPVGILTMHQYMDAEATTETVDYETLKELIEPNRDKDPVKLSDNDKLTIPTDPTDGITYRLESLHFDAATEEATTVFDGVVQLRLPAMDAHDDKAVLGDNDLAIYRGTNYDLALGATDTGFASYIVVLNENAPTDYEFEMDLPSGYKLSEDGNNGIEILDEENEIIGKMSAPWAVDADGDEIATVYKLRGNRLVQTLSHSGASYPVVADPSYSFAAAIYVRWNLVDDFDDALDDADDKLGDIQGANCSLIPGGLALLFNFPGVAIGAVYCIGVSHVVDDAQDSLDDIDDDLSPVLSSLPTDCTLMLRLAYIALWPTSVRVEDCGWYSHEYYYFVD